MIKDKVLFAVLHDRYLGNYIRTRGKYHIKFLKVSTKKPLNYMTSQTLPPFKTF